MRTIFLLSTNAAGVLNKMRAHPQGLASNTIYSVAATRIEIPYWRFCSYPFAVLAGAMGEATGLPFVFFLDNFMAIFNVCTKISQQILGVRYS